ncbi:hypothetical protein ACIPJG_33010 [Streptomyces halstedii]
MPYAAYQLAAVSVAMTAQARSMPRRLPRMSSAAASVSRTASEDQ